MFCSFADAIDLFHKVLDVRAFPVLFVQVLIVEEQNVDVHPHDVDGAQSPGVATAYLDALQSTTDLWFTMLRMGDSQAVEESFRLHANGLRPYTLRELDVAKQLPEQLFGRVHVDFLVLVSPQGNDDFVITLIHHLQNY